MRIGCDLISLPLFRVGLESPGFERRPPRGFSTTAISLAHPADYALATVVLS